MDSYIYKMCCFLGAHLPLPFLYFLGWIIANLKYIFIYSVRRHVRANVKIVLEYRKAKKGIDYTEKELHYTVKKIYCNFSRYLTDFFNIPKWDIDRIREKVTIENIELLDEGLSAGKGVIALTAHIGNWELAGIVTSILGYKVTAVAIPYLNSSVTRIYKKRRNSKGIDVLLTGTNPKGHLRALRQNKVLAVLGDKVFTEKGVKTRFLGIEALLPRGPATLAVKTGACFTAGFFIMEEYRYRFFFKKIPCPGKDMSEEEQISFLFKEGAKIIEDIIVEHPAQWLNFAPVVQGS